MSKDDKDDSDDNNDDNDDDDDHDFTLSVIRKKHDRSLVSY